MAEMMELFCLLAFTLFCQTTSGEDFNRTLFAFQTDDKNEINDVYRQLSFKWFTGGWSKCRPLNSQLDTTCPHTGLRMGVQIRKVACLSRCQDNSEVMSRISADRLDHITTEEETDSACKSNNMTPPASTRTCHIPCPVDCIFTAFGHWKCLEFAKMNEIDKSKVSHHGEDISITKGHRKKKMLDQREISNARIKNNYAHPSTCDVSFRVRTIFLEAQNGGRMCPRDMIEFRDNKNTVKIMSPPGNAIKFRVGRWSVCERFAADDNPVLHLGSSFYERLGRRKRNITVIQESSEAGKHEYPLSLEFCIPDNDIMFAEQSKSHSQDDSQFPFNLIDSIFGPWTTYDSSQYGLFEAETLVKSASLFDNGYFSNFFDQTLERKVEGHKFRSPPLKEWLMRKILGLNGHEGGDEDDDDDVSGGSDGVESHEDDENEDDENCSKFDWLVGRWTSCITRDGGCGAGVQNRSVVCVRLSDKVPVTDLSCRHTPPIYSRTCQLPCPSDCMVSQWSSWSACPVERCKGKLREATSSLASKIRSRIVVKSGANGGSECPSLVQVKPCDVLPCYTWRVMGRGPCVIHTGASCGADGNVSVSFECLDIEGERVSHKYCPFETRPNQWERCSIPCENDCVISEWSDWSPCDASEHPRRPIGYRARYKEILATAGKGGIQCVNLRLAIDKERCPASSKAIYQWAVGNWSSCMMRAEDGKSFDLGSPDDPGVPYCQKQGIQRREVHCVDAEGEKASNRRCPTERTPPLERPCLLKCRVDCVVTLFSDWLPCPVTCLAENLPPPHQLRYRFVLEYPREGGMGCPPLLEGRPCLDLPRCSRLSWKVSAWSKCLVASSEDGCGNGIRNRDVLCVDLDTNEHKPNRFCSMARRFRPHRLEFCHISCVDAGDQNCPFTDWNGWSTCSKRCDGIRWRYRTSESTVHHPHHHARSHHSCQVKTNSLVESQRCNSYCLDMSVKFIGQWSHCILNEAPLPSGHWNLPSVVSSHESGIGLMRAASKYCGIGSQYHAIACSQTEVNDDDDDSNGVESKIDISLKSNMAPLHCSSENIREEMCFSSCKRDCLMSKWSDWKPCETNQRCGIGVTWRSRFILETSLDGGRSCPPIEGNQEEQKMPCYVSCDQFQWLAGDWSICAPIGQSLAGRFQIGQCGSGLQTRSVRCVKVSHFGDTSEEVETSSCDRRTKPRELLKCHIPCHDECAVTMWSTWSHCPEDCTLRHRSSRRRHRRVIRNPSNSSCPRLSEEESCSSSQFGLEPDLSCESYEVAWSDWSPCATLGICGPGKRKRFAQCQTASDGKVADEEICRKDQALMQKLTEVDELSCEVPCVIDCVISEWLPWSPCSASCGLGYRTRTRSILIGQQNGGSLCPEVMLQNVSCPFQECFRWMAVGFEGCVIEKNSCGHGYQLMQFECTKLSTDGDGDDEEVDEALCSFRHLPKVPLVQPCYVPCPDECELSHWSSWSRCHVACSDQNTPLVQHGLQTRTRHVLVRSFGRTPCDSTPLIQSRVCLAKISACKVRPVYDWQVGEWVRGERSVWCQDDLGHRVQGGCDNTRRPSSVQSCDHRCESIRIPHSRCLTDGRCGCAPGFEPVYSDSDHLQRCRSEKRTPDSFHLGIFSLKSDVGEAHRRRTWIDDEDDIIITRTNGWTYAIATIGLTFMAVISAAIYYVWRSKNIMNTSCTAVSAPPAELTEKDPFRLRQTQVHPSATVDLGCCHSPHL